MIQILNLNKSYGTQSIFKDVSFSMAPGERLGLVGRNGSGKTTLLKLIRGEEEPDSGKILLPRDYKCGHLEQHLHFRGETALKEACLGLGQEERNLEYKGEIILAGLGFSKEDMRKDPRLFSGGFQIRIELAKVLLGEPNLLLLDEPTNYLDIVSARWLERFLAAWKNELILITHDRSFMDSVVTHTMLIRRSDVRKINGSTGALYTQVAQEEEIYEQTRLNQEQKKKDMEAFITRFRAKASKASIVQSRVKALERLGKMEELEGEAEFDFRFRTAPFPGRTVFQIESLDFSYEPEKVDSYLISRLSLEIKKKDCIGVVGKNGRGKSTFLRLLAGELQSVSGEVKRSSNAQVAYFGQSNVQRLSPNLTIEEEIFSANQALSRTTTRNICGTMMFDGDRALKKIAVLSGGEKSRVLLGKLLAQPSNVLLLDEPSNHLDQESVEVMIESLKEYEGVVVIVTHNERILRELATRLVVFQGERPYVFEGGYNYFLEKVGWEEEQGQLPSTTTITEKENAGTGDKLSSKDLRQQKALVRQARAQALKPLQAAIKGLEDEICALEEQVKTGELELIEAAQKKDGARVATLSKRLAEARRRIDECFNKLEPVTREHDQLEAKFESQLCELGGESNC